MKNVEHAQDSPFIIMANVLPNALKDIIPRMVLARKYFVNLGFTLRVNNVKNAQKGQIYLNATMDVPKALNSKEMNVFLFV